MKTQSMSEPCSIELTTSPPEDDDLEEVALSNQRFLQLLVFAAACFMSTQVRESSSPLLRPGWLGQVLGLQAARRVSSARAPRVLDGPCRRLLAKSPSQAGRV